MRSSQSLPTQLPCRAGPTKHACAGAGAGAGNVEFLNLPSSPPTASVEVVGEETELSEETPVAVVVVFVAKVLAQDQRMVVLGLHERLGLCHQSCGA